MENLYCHDLIDEFEKEIENVHEELVDDEEEEYSVEEILDKRVNSETGKDEYFLKWKGYSSAEGKQIIFNFTNFSCEFPISRN